MVNLMIADSSIFQDQGTIASEPLLGHLLTFSVVFTSPFHIEQVCCLTGARYR